MSNGESRVHLLPWTIPKPVGLWYRAFVLTQNGIYITPEVDFTTIEALKAALDQGEEAVLELLTVHGRSKRSQFVPISLVSGLTVNEPAGTLHLKVSDDSVDNPMVRIPKRDQLPKLAKALTAFIKRSREQAS